MQVDTLDIEGKVKRAGYAVVAVIGDQANPTFAYTIGLSETYSHPEIITIGLPARTAHHLISRVVDVLEDGGCVPLDGRMAEIASGFDMFFAAVKSDRVQDRMLACVSRYGEDFPVMQMVWPDKNNVFAWEDGYDISEYAGQPILFEYNGGER